MKLRILLVNPWIYDFAAADLWSRPLGLQTVAEYLSHYDTELQFLDCMDDGAEKKSGRGKYRKTIISKPACLLSVPRKYGRYGISLEFFRSRLGRMQRPDVVFITSVMSYWYPGVQQAVGMIRELWGSMPVVLGGIYATLWPEHASETSGADLVYEGRIDEKIRFGLGTFGFRLRKINSPKAADQYHGAFGKSASAPLLSSFGCPFRCSYCGSGRLHETFCQRDPSEVLKEIRKLHAVGIKDIAFYDDALLVSAERHIKIILKGILDSRLDLRFHCPNGLHAQFVDDELAWLMKASGFSTIRLSLETIDLQRQLQTGGKVSAGDLIRAVRALKKQGFTKEHIGVYLMYGLPGQGLEEVKDGVSFLKDHSVRIYLAEFSPVPGTDCWEELIQRGIISRTIDPLLTNNSVFSYLFSGYNHEELRKLKLAVKGYNIS